MYLVVFFLLGIDGLVAYRAVMRLVLHEGTISPDAPLFLLLLLALQILLVVLFFRLREVIGYYQRLKDSYEHELELNRQLMDNVEVALSVISAEGRYTYVNRACAELLGLPVQELLGRSPVEFVADIEGVDSNPNAGSFVLTTQELEQAVTLRRASGELVRANLKITPRLYGGRVVGVIASVIPQSVIPQPVAPATAIPGEAASQAGSSQGNP